MNKEKWGQLFSLSTVNTKNNWHKRVKSRVQITGTGRSYVQITYIIVGRILRSISTEGTGQHAQRFVFVLLFPFEKHSPMLHHNFPLKLFCNVARNTNQSHPWIWRTTWMDFKILDQCFLITYYPLWGCDGKKVRKICVYSFRDRARINRTSPKCA